MFNKWVKAIRTIKETIENFKQKEKEQVKIEMSQVSINKERAQQAFGVLNRSMQFNEESKAEELDLGSLLMAEQNIKSENTQKMEEIKKKMSIHIANRINKIQCANKTRMSVVIEVEDETFRESVSQGTSFDDQQKNIGSQNSSGAGESSNRDLYQLSTAERESLVRVNKEDQIIEETADSFTIIDD